MLEVSARSQLLDVYVCFLSAIPLGGDSKETDGGTAAMTGGKAVKEGAGRPASSKPEGTSTSGKPGASPTVRDVKEVPAESPKKEASVSPTSPNKTEPVMPAASPDKKKTGSYLVPITPSIQKTKRN